MSDTCRLFPPFGDPWPSCLLPYHFHRLQSPGPGLQRQRSLSFLPPWEFQTPLSLGTPRFPINLPRKWLSQKQWGTKVKRQTREGDAVGKLSERVFNFIKHLQVNVQLSEGVCSSLLFTEGQGQTISELSKGTLVYSQAEGRVLQASYWVWL